MTQDHRIARAFEGGEALTAHEARQRAGADLPITSVRRSIHGLTECGILERLEEKRPGPFGKANTCWRKRQKR